MAPSANLEGEEPAKTIAKAQEYFGDTVGFYMDQGQLDSPPSTLVAIEGDEAVVKRTGAVDIKF